MMVLRLILKGTLKVYFRSVISSLIMMRSLAIKYKLGLRLFLFFTSKTQNIWCVTHSVICLLGYSRKNPNGGGGEVGLRIYFLEKPPEIFHFFTLPLEIADKKKLSPWIFYKIVLDPLEIPKPKTQTDPLEFPHYFFLVTL